MRQVIQLPADWGEAEIRPAGPRIACSSTAPGAYDHLGNRLSWAPPPSFGATKYACDLEDSGQDIAFMASRFGLAPATFFQNWVATEVLAKLADVPILQWLKSRGLLACETGQTIRTTISDRSGGSEARLMVYPHGDRVMAFGIICEPSTLPKHSTLETHGSFQDPIR